MKNVNGLGTVYRRGNTYTIKITVGFKPAEDGHFIQVTKTKGGFPTAREALLYGPTLRQEYEDSLRRFHE